MLEKRRILVSTFLCLAYLHFGWTSYWYIQWLQPSPNPEPSSIWPHLYKSDNIPDISPTMQWLPAHLKLDGGFFALIFSSLHSGSQKFYVFIRIRSKKQKTFLYLQHSPTQRIMVTGCWQALLLLTMPPAPIMYLFFHIVVPAKSLAKNEPLLCTCFCTHKTYCNEFIHDLS